MAEIEIRDVSKPPTATSSRGDLKPQPRQRGDGEINALRWLD